MARKQTERVVFFTLLFASIGALWRRYFGSGQAGPRFIKYVVLVLAVGLMYLCKGIFDLHSWRMYVVIVSFAYFWARSHGDYFHVYDTSPDEGRIKWIDWVLEKLYGKEGYYNFKGNVTGLWLRYTATAVLVACCIPNVYFVLAGVLVTLSYIIFGKSSRPTEYAEYLAGALVFGLLYLCLPFNH